MNSGRSAPWRRLPARRLPAPTGAGFRRPPENRATSLHCSRHPPEHDECRSPFARRYRGVCRDRAACRSWGARVDALRVGQVDRADGNHLHCRPARRCCRHHDHGGDTAERSERQSFDHLLIGDDVVSPRRQDAIDALDLEGVLEGDHFPPRARGHSPPSFADRSAPTLVLCMDSPCALLARLAIAFSRKRRYRPNNRRLTLYSAAFVAICAVRRKQFCKLSSWKGRTTWPVSATIDFIAG